MRLGADDFGMQEAVAGTSIGGHRGGVTCIDMPPRMHRHDSLVPGGEYGLIKLWSLKSPSSDQDGAAQKNSIKSRFFHNHQITSIATDLDSSCHEGVLTGHERKTICSTQHGMVTNCFLEGLIKQ